MAPRTPVQKRTLDLVVTIVSIPFLIPLFGACLLAILCLEGRPVFYVSRRRIHGEISAALLKFRTMRRNADQIANRDTVPCEKTRFLNISSDSPLYTPVGRLIERLMLTELPQVIHVLQGRMSLVGNRPLPENVIASLREIRPDVCERFSTPTGLTGPVQLVGRDLLTDHERLDIEIAYCRRVQQGHSIWLDLKVLSLTVLVGLVSRARLTPAQVLAMIRGQRPGPAGAGTIPQGMASWRQRGPFAKFRRLRAPEAL